MDICPGKERVEGFLTHSAELLDVDAINITGALACATVAHCGLQEFIIAPLCEIPQKRRLGETQ